MMNKGVFCLSIDVELLWGRHDRDWRSFVPAVSQSRSIIKELLELLEEYNIAATWAIVGHLFLNSRKNDPGWYGRDIVRLIKKHPRQEIACHSFSHVMFGDPGCSRECADSEINACVKLAKKERVSLTSFVFPKNNIGHLDLLKKYEFSAYRGKETNPFQRTKIAKLLTLFSPLSPPVHSPSNNDGLCNIPSSMYIPSSRGLRRFIPNNLIVSSAKRGIDRAISEGKIFHLWTHPEDLTGEDPQRIRAFEKILSYAASLQSKEKLTIIPMASIS